MAARRKVLSFRRRATERRAVAAAIANAADCAVLIGAVDTEKLDATLQVSAFE
jgi:hypothetical protein